MSNQGTPPSTSVPATPPAVTHDFPASTPDEAHNLLEAVTNALTGFREQVLAPLVQKIDDLAAQITGGKPTVAPDSTTLTAAAAAGDTSLSTSSFISSGSVIQVGSETVTASGDSVGKGPYATPVTALSFSHAAGDGCTVKGAGSVLDERTAEAQLDAALGVSATNPNPPQV